MKTKLHLCAVNGGPFNCKPAFDIELDNDRILCNDVHLPWESHMRGGPKLYVIGNEFGAVCAVWADCEQEAFNEMVDSDLGDSFLVSEDDQKDATEAEQEEWERLGNADEPCDLTYAWIQVVGFDYLRDIQLLCRFAEARGNGSKTLDT